MSGTDDTVTELAAHRAPGLSRRGFLGASAVVGMGAVLVACGDDGGSSSGGGSTDTSPTTGADGGGASGDLAVAQLAAGLEVLAVNTYTAALDAAGSGALGEVPPAVAEYVTTAQSQHQAALDAWNDVLTGAGETAVTDPPADLEMTVNDKFAQVTDVAGAANLALELEGIAAATYLEAAATLEGEDATKLAASIAVVDRQHMAVLLFALGQYPVPEVFASLEASAA